MLTCYSFPYASHSSIGTSLPNLSSDGTDFKGERLTVQFARGPRRKDDFGPQERNVPRPRRTVFRMDLKGLAPETSWQVRHSPPCIRLGFNSHNTTGSQGFRSQLWSTGRRLLGDWS